MLQCLCKGQAAGGGRLEKCRLEKANRQRGGDTQMMENYLVKDFQRTAAQRFPAQAEQLNATFDARLRTLWEENAGASREKKEHLRAVWLSGALPVLLRQRRYQLCRPAPEAPLAPHQDAGPRRRLLRLLPENPGSHRQGNRLRRKSLTEFAAPQAANKVKSVFLRRRVRRKKHFARREYIFARKARKNARVGAKPFFKRKHPPEYPAGAFVCFKRENHTRKIGFFVCSYVTLD